MSNPTDNAQFQKFFRDVKDGLKNQGVQITEEAARIFAEEIFNKADGNLLKARHNLALALTVIGLPTLFGAGVYALLISGKVTRETISKGLSGLSKVVIETIRTSK